MEHLPSVAQMRPITQPPTVLGRPAAEHWTGTLYLRRISPYVTRLLSATRITPNGVTWLMIASGVAAGVALLLPGWPGVVLAVLCTQVQMLLDCSDGELARWRGHSSASGVFLDKLGHYAAEGVIPLALGVRADGGLDSIGGWTTLGALLAGLVLFNKALNDMVHAARASAGLDPLGDQPGIGTPRKPSVRRLRSVARFVPFYRMYHSVELSILALVAAIVDAALGGGLMGTQYLVLALLAASVVTVAGHLAAILSSRQLR